MYHVILFTVLNVNYNYFHIKPLFTILYICHHWDKISRTWWYILNLLEDYVTVHVDDPIWRSSVFITMQIYISEVFMSYSVMLLNILELNYVITSKVLICIVAVLIWRPHSCLVAHTPELFKKWHWNFHPWNVLQVECALLSNSSLCFLQHHIFLPVTWNLYVTQWLLLHVTLSLLLSCRDTSRITPQESHFLHLCHMDLYSFFKTCGIISVLFHTKMPCIS